MNGSHLTRRHVRHALGYIGLEMFPAAEAELDAVPAAEQSLPVVRSVRVDLCMAAKQWPAAVREGSELTRDHPECENAWIGWAYALRELQCVSEARQVLLAAEKHHGGTSAVLHYNLACYDSLLGDIASARRRLATACRMDKAFKAASEDDPDLAALREAEARGKKGRAGGSDKGE
jgi:predicted Zn-dependent protease